MKRYYDIDFTNAAEATLKAKNTNITLGKMVT